MEIEEVNRNGGTGVDSSEEKVGSEEVEEDRIGGIDGSEDFRIGISEDCGFGGTVHCAIVGPEESHFSMTHKRVLDKRRVLHSWSSNTELIVHPRLIDAIAVQCDDK